jgi:erythromycin esterase-like protein
VNRERAFIELEARESTAWLGLGETIPHRLASGAYQMGFRAMKGHVGASTEGEPIVEFEVRNAAPHTVEFRRSRSIGGHK